MAKDTKDVTAQTSSRGKDKGTQAPLIMNKTKCCKQCEQGWPPKSWELNDGSQVKDKHLKK